MVVRGLELELEPELGWLDGTTDEVEVGST